MALYTLPFAAAATRGQTDIGDLAPVRLVVGPGWAASAAIVHFRVSEDGTTYYPLWASGTAYTVAVSASQASVVDPTKFYGVHSIRIVGTRARGTAAGQTTACTVGIVAQRI